MYGYRKVQKVTEKEKRQHINLNRSANNAINWNASKYKHHYAQCTP